MHFWHQLNDWFPHLWVGIWAFWAINIALLSGWVILQKREAAATLSWLFALAFLPVIGFVIYHFLGPQRIRRQQSKRLRSKALVEKHTKPAAVLPPVARKQQNYWPAELTVFPRY